jgi:hypothetical protein
LAQYVGAILMPITYQIDRLQDVTIFHLFGEITIHDLINSIREYLHQGKTFYAIYDFRCLGEASLSVEKIQMLSDFIIRKSSRLGLVGRTAIVVDREIHYNLFQMLSSLVKNKIQIRVNVFRNISDAYSWLDYDATPEPDACTAWHSVA